MRQLKRSEQMLLLKINLEVETEQMEVANGL